MKAKISLFIEFVEHFILTKIVQSVKSVKLFILVKHSKNEEAFIIFARLLIDIYLSIFTHSVEMLLTWVSLIFNKSSVELTYTKDFTFQWQTWQQENINTYFILSKRKEDVL